MSNQTDFSWIGSLIILAAGLTYNALYEFSTVLGITWIDANLSTRPPFEKPDPEYGGILVVIILVCIISALNYMYKKIDQDLENGVISKDAVKKVYNNYILLYFSILGFLVVFAPIFMPIVRTWF